MSNFPLIDIHTHHDSLTDDSIAYKSLFLNDEIPNHGYYTVGLHPWELNNLAPDWESLLQVALKNKNCLGLGECGLDRSIDFLFEQQKEIFLKQLELHQQQSGKVVVLHCVRAYSDIIPIIKKYKCFEFIIHDYNASPEQTQELLKYNVSFSFGKKLFQPQTKAMKSLPLIPLDKVFCETDNTTYKIEEIYQEMATLRKTTLDHLRKTLYQNLQRLIA